MLVSFIFIMGLTNAMIRPILLHIEEFGFLHSAINGFGISFIVWFAVYCGLHLLYQDKGSTMATSPDIAIGIITLVLLCLPSSLLSWIFLSCFAAYCSVFMPFQTTAPRHACAIILAVSLRIPISELCLRLSADTFLQFDAVATQTLLQFLDPEIIRQGNILIGSSGHELLIMTGCASFTNISLALLLWFTIVRSKITIWKHSFNLYIAPLCILVMGINIFRLSMMTLSVDLYHFYHDELGADITNVAILLIALLTALTTLHFHTYNHKGETYVST